MTLKQIIDQASTLGQQLPDGLNTEVKLWNIGKEPLPVAGVASTSRLQIGNSQDRKGVIAYLTIKP